MAHPVRTPRVGRYQLVHRLAVGGMGEIFLARERGLAGFDRQVVVKLLIPELAEQPDLVTLFIDEARIAANLTHPNIVQVYEFGQDAAGYYLAMEYVPGQNLARIAARAVKDPRGLLTRELAVHLIAEMARGLDYAHRAHDAEGRPLGIVHRDVSPHNLLLSIHGDVKVMDFGIAKSANTLHRTATGVVRGKYAYMSPEQLAGESLDAMTDVYSAGVMLWELTLMRRLWTGKDELAVIEQVRAGNVARPREIDPAYPADLEEIVMHAIARDRERRTASAAALEADLRGWLALHGAVIDRSALGRVVTTLFPEVDHVAPARVDADAGQVTASLPQPATVLDKPAPATSTPSQPPRARSRLGITVAVTAAAAVVAGSGYALTRRGARTSSPESTPIAHAPPTIDAAIAMDVQAPVDAADDARGSATTTQVEPPHDSGVATQPPPRRRPPTTTVVASPDPTPPQPTHAPPPAPADGWLAIEIKPWGTVSVPGFATRETTPKRIKVPAGSYAVTVQVAGGSTVTATAKVEPGATTKCRGDERGLECKH